jgi:hypothetical protein
MLAALIIIGTLGIGLPLVAFLGSRWRMSRPGRDPDRDELDRWLISEFGLGWSDRSKVRQAVLGRSGTTWPDHQPGPLPPRLLEPARALATRVLADREPRLRLSRRMGWVWLCLAPAYGGFGVFLLVSGPSGDQTQGVLFVANACLATAAATGTAILGPRRVRRRAESLLDGTRLAAARQRMSAWRRRARIRLPL